MKTYAICLTVIWTVGLTVIHGITINTPNISKITVEFPQVERMIDRVEEIELKGE